jgi:enamine deaminase RidA (YjgF/YER057c/UK114 family)
MGRHFPAMALLEVRSLFVPNSKVELEATAIL